MVRPAYRYRFASDVPVREIYTTMLLVFLAVECLHGAAQVRLDAAHVFDPVARICVLDASTTVGCDANRLFAGFLRREFGDRAFDVECFDTASASGQREACA